MLLWIASALAAMTSASLDAPVPVVADLDLLPEPGTWPCQLTIQVDGLGTVTDVDLDEGCPSGLRQTAADIAKGWRFGPMATAHTEKATIAFRVLSQDAPEPKAESKPGALVVLLRPMDVLAPPPTAPDAPIRVDKGPKTRLPRGAEPLGLIAGTCSVRIDVGADGKVTRARADRCLDTLAADAVAAAKKITFVVPEGNTTTSEYDVAIRFEAPK